MESSRRPNAKHRAAPARPAIGRRDTARPFPGRGRAAWVRPAYRRRAILRRKLLTGLLAAAAALALAIIANSAALRANGAVVLARRELPCLPVFFCQTDPAWAGDTLGASERTLGEAGDGVTCLASLIEMQQLAAPIGGSVDPGTLNAWLAENGAYDPEGNLDWTAAARLLGVGFSQRQPGWGISRTLEWLLQREVYPVARVKLPDTGAFHDVLVVGTVHGEFLIMDPLDPSGEPNSLSVYDNRIYAIKTLKRGR